MAEWAKHWNSSATGYSSVSVKFDDVAADGAHEGNTIIHESEDEEDTASLKWKAESSGGGYASPYTYASEFTVSAWATWEYDFSQLASV